MEKSKRVEMLLWSIAFPGFGQLLNGKILKGIILISLELIINVRSHLNEIIIFSFKGDIEKSINQTDFQWLMFYPCVYIFGIWDAYKDAGGGTTSYAVFPFAFGAFFGTVGIIYSRYVLGPVWLGIAGLSLGIAIGYMLRAIILNKT